MAKQVRARGGRRRAVVRNRRGESTRAMILEAAHRLLGDQGFEAVSVDRVAKAAGVTRSSIYHQFGSRDGFVLHLIAESLRSLQRERRKGRADSALQRFLDEAEAGFRGDPNLLRMFYQLVFVRTGRRPEIDRLLRDAYRYRTRRYAEGLARDLGTRPARDAETLAIVLAAALDGLYAHYLVDLDPAGLRRAFAVLRELIEARAGRKSTRHQ